MEKYQPTIGLEIHAELKTRTKMFCDSLNDPDEKHPNENVCPVCLSHPGTLPTINKAAIESVIKVGLALGGKINPITKFDRKNYFYPDLPKGYQISQYDQPLVLGGELNGVRIRRIHLEEDTGTLIHEAGSMKHEAGTLVDFNRAGVPLMELVTEPDLKSAEEVVAFARELQLILRYLSVSNADMEKGQMRIEANVSVAKSGDSELGTKVELKNINSFKAAKAAIEYELKRQMETLEQGEKIIQETRGWDELKQKTVSRRSKEEAHDYRYFPEPDLPPFETNVFEIEKLKLNLPELPTAKRERFKKEYGLNEKQTELLISDLLLSEYFEDMNSEVEELCSQMIDTPQYKGKIGDYGDPRTGTFLDNVRKRAISFLLNEVQGLKNQSGEVGKITPEHLAHFSYLIEFGVWIDHSKAVGRQKAQEVLLKIFQTGEDPEDIFKRDMIYTISDDSELQLVVSEIVAEHIGPVNDYKKGKTQALQFLIGQAMARLKGKGNPKKLSEIIERIIKSSEE